MVPVKVMNRWSKGISFKFRKSSFITAIMPGGRHFTPRVLAFHFSRASRNEMSAYECKKEFRASMKRLAGEQEYLQQEERMREKHQCLVQRAIN
ncbi:hypothetical protein AVEN_250420-1 [Araneus ventricosus]|uniref:Uncharacterized protein n=1 Tax=Araneus ventricosus TaxID=182803 RepID=A0A4Y2EGJ9_ARAVE|nr:hypothetical protein AVEN_250420-1 [Araneus ventricosus]